MLDLAWVSALRTQESVSRRPFIERVSAVGYPLAVFELKYDKFVRLGGFNR
jgi:hypothetical protein